MNKNNIENKNKIKRSKYIGKYDFLRSLNRPECLWFRSDEEVLKILSENEITLNEEDEVDEFDAVDYLRKQQHFFEKTSNLIDESNAKLIEGRIIDQKAKTFIINNYQNSIEKNKTINVYDFDKLLSGKYSLKKRFEYFKNLLNKKENAIFFQATFIDEKRKLVTKPDALIFMNGKWELIEVKGTTTSKKHYLLDLLFQKNVIYGSGLDIKIFNYYLCLVAYEKAKKNDVTFVLTKTFLPKKNYCDTAKIKKKINLLGSLDEEVISDKQKEKIGLTEKAVTFNDFLRPKNFNPSLDNKKFIEWIQFYYNNIYDQFDEIVKKLNEAAKKNKNPQKNLLPSWIFHSFFQNFEYNNQLKEFFVKNGYTSFKYSGNVLCWNYSMIAYEQQMNDQDIIYQLSKNKNYLQSYLENLKEKNPQIYISKSVFSKIGCFYANCLATKKQIYANISGAKKLLDKMKENKVYFDFETISSSIRPIDDILPFTQIVTQCSIIKKMKNCSINRCLNLLVDPQNISVNFFKKIIDSLFAGNDCSYVVYNQDFEKTRLKEMVNHIKNDSYTEKINTIIDNIFDLADFFNLATETICIKELYGNYSIKKVLPIVLHDEKIVKKTKIMDYQKLTVKKGDQCQNITAQRFHNLINKKDWKKIEKDLKIYCENDVRAMIAVEEFIKKVIKNYNK